MKNEKARRYYARNRERILASARARRSANIEIRRAEEREYAKKRRDADPELRVQQNDRLRAWKKDNPARYHVQTLRSKARHRGIEWVLPERLALDLVTDNCFYCGAAPAPTNGIDRVDNSKGYVEDNVVTSCRPCNVAKLDRPLDGFLAWIQQAHAYQERYFRNPI